MTVDRNQTISKFFFKNKNKKIQNKYKSLNVTHQIIYIEVGPSCSLVLEKH